MRYSNWTSKRHKNRFSIHQLRHDCSIVCICLGEWDPPTAWISPQHQTSIVTATKSLPLSCTYTKGTFSPFGQYRSVLPCTQIQWRVCSLPGGDQRLPTTHQRVQRSLYRCCKTYGLDNTSYITLYLYIFVFCMVYLGCCAPFSSRCQEGYTSSHHWRTSYCGSGRDSNRAPWAQLANPVSIFPIFAWVSHLTNWLQEKWRLLEMVSIFRGIPISPCTWFNTWNGRTCFNPTSFNLATSTLVFSQARFQCDRCSEPSARTWVGLHWEAELSAVLLRYVKSFPLSQYGRATGWFHGGVPCSIVGFFVPVVPSNRRRGLRPSDSNADKPCFHHCSVAWAVVGTWTSWNL